MPKARKTRPAPRRLAAALLAVGVFAPLTAAASHDDILRANNGRFIGPASSY